MLVTRCSMYGIFTYIYHKFKPNVGKYSIHGSYGLGYISMFSRYDMKISWDLLNVMNIEYRCFSISISKEFVVSNPF